MDSHQSIELFVAIQTLVIAISHIAQPRAWVDFFVWLRGKGHAGVFANGFLSLWFGAFIPQFIDPTRDYLMQIAIMGPTAMAVALASDGFYAVAVGRARRLLTRRRVRFINRASGACLIGGGVWLALSRSR